MGGHWALIAILLASAGAGFAAESESPRLRTLIGGYASLGYPATSISLYAGPVGVAADLGMQFDDRLSLSVHFRASTFAVANHVQLTPSLEWSAGLFSVGFGAGGAAFFTFFPFEGAQARFFLAMPLTLGLTLGETRASGRLRSVRLNLEAAFLVSPVPYGFAATLGLSIASLTR